MKESNTTKITAKEPEFKELSWDKFLELKLLIQKFKTIEVNLMGKSMNPLMHQGDKVHVTKFESINKLKRFDILVFWSGDLLVCHYFWRKNSIFIDSELDPVIMTRPLNPIRAYDAPIKASQILGTVNDVKISFWLKLKVAYYFKFA